MSPPHLFLEHPIHVCYEFYHLRVGDDPVTVDVKDSEYFDEDLLRCPVRHDVIHDHELGEVHHPVVVLVVDPEHVTLHLLRLADRQHLVDHLLEHRWLHSA